jgi:sulfoxide reductase heme-binding subunit YedZ
MSFADTLDHGWWLASRAAGIVAYLLLSASVLLGLAMALRLIAPRATAVLRAAHERLGLLALGAVATHALLLLGDGWLRPRVTDLLVPFTMDYRPVWTGLGILAFYLTAALSLTYYARRRIGARRWRTAHRLIPAAWAIAAVHVIGAGTDAGSLWLQLPIALTIALVVAFLGERLLAGRAPGATRTPRRVPVPVPVPATATPPAAATVARATAPTEPYGVIPRFPPRPDEAVTTVASRDDEAVTTAMPRRDEAVTTVAPRDDETVTAVIPRDDEPVTTAAPPPGYRPLWARDPSAPPRR